MIVSRRTLNILSALVWIVGGIVLVVRGTTLLAEAQALRRGLAWPWLGAAIGLLLGAAQARFPFRKSCHRNLDRIAALERPRLWQFYRPGFFVALFIMIGTGVTLSRLAHGNYPFLIVVGGVELNVGVALLGSSPVFWQRRAFTPSGEGPGS
jgi:hypothetical protein